MKIKLFHFQTKNPNGISENLKKWTASISDWYFAYTQISSDIVASAGVPINKITVLNNSLDTAELKRLSKTITAQEASDLRVLLGFSDGPVAVFIGSLYSDKRLDFLFSSADVIHKVLPDFNLLIIGDGNERNKVKALCSERPWSRWVGSSLERDKAAYLSLASIMMNPGLVGLGILDSFACEIPMLTTDCGLHSPEISYLVNGRNGIVTNNDLDSYVSACLSLLCDNDKLSFLREGCRASAQELTIENMAHRFSNGILSCLGTPRNMV